MLTLSPDPSATEAEIVSWYGDAAHRGSMTIGLSVSIMAAISFLWFVAVIRRRVGEREDRFFATVFLGSGILVTAVMLVGAAVLASPALTIDLADGRVPDAAVLSGLSGLGATLLLVVLLGVQAVFVASTSTLGLRTTTLRLANTATSSPRPRACRHASMMAVSISWGVPSWRRPRRS